MSGRPPGGSADVYTLVDADARAIYVGYSYHLGRRLQEHRRKPWWPDVRGVVTQHYDHWYDAKNAERALIEELQPVHNVAYTLRDPNRKSVAA